MAQLRLRLCLGLRQMLWRKRRCSSRAHLLLHVTTQDQHLTSSTLPQPCCLIAASGDDYGPAPDLDHANPELRDALKDWLRWLHEDIGFGGWRLDFARGWVVVCGVG